MGNFLVPKKIGVYDFQSAKQTLEDRLKAVVIEQGEAESEAKKAGLKLVKDKLLGRFFIADLINTYFKWNDETDKAIKSKKRDRLLERYFDQTEENNKSIAALTEFISNPCGNTLFNKIICITDNNPPDVELLEHLSVVLKNMVNSEFERMFEEHKYALSQIDRLTPQALTILSDDPCWPSFSLGSYNTSGGIVTSEWVDQFSEAYAQAKEVSDISVRHRISHAVRELHNNRYIFAVSNEDKESFKCRFTQIGYELEKYLKVSNTETK